MTPKEKISKLEELLARIKARASAPRPSNGVAGFAQAQAPRPDTIPPETAQPKRPSTVPPAAYPTPPPPTEAEADLEVEVSAEVVEVEIDVDEPTAAFAESGSQPVADHRPLPEEPEPEPPRHAGPPANEIEEPAPSSSPRPIADAQYDAEESAPRHTPPPESGKQVAATPVPPRRPSAPPPSLEGHTLIGGWREPGLAPIAPHVSHGVRVPAPAPQPVEAASTVVQHVPPRALSPEVTKPDLPGTARVAAFEGAPPPAKPLTFGDLIDETLKL